MSRKKYDRKSGIYMYHFNNDVSKNYIGCSINMHSRHLGHCSTLRNNNHDNPKFQRAYNKYGKDSMIYIELEEMKFPEYYPKNLIRQHLECREKYYQELYNSRYVILKGGDRNINYETVRKIKLYTDSKKVTVYQVTESLDIIKKFVGLREAERELSKGLYFRFDSTLGIVYDKKIPYREMSVNCYNLDGSLHRSYESTRQVSRDLSIDASAISRRLVEPLLKEIVKV